MNLEVGDEVVVIGDFVVFGEFGDVLDLLFDFVQFVGQGVDVYDCLELVVEIVGVDIQGVVVDYVVFFQFVQVFGDVWG